MTMTFVVKDTLIDAPLSTPNIPATNITGFPTGIYFEIRARGSNNILKTRHFSGEDNAQIQLWPRPSDGNELRAAVSILRFIPSFLPQPTICKSLFQAFFIDRTGALCHGSGLNVDIVGKGRKISMTMTSVIN
jgi:hypothetical protein